MNSKYIFFPNWLQEFKRFQALKSQFFIYGNVYDSYYFPVNYKETLKENELRHIKFPDIQSLLIEYLLKEEFEVVTYFDIIDGLSIQSNDDTINEDNLVNALNLTKE
ncbi:MAG: hypothetical protein ACJAYY_001901, partial [Paraglaciecola sp.]